MNTVILSKTYADIPICETEILRYAGCKATDPQTDKLLAECIAEIDGKISGKICYTVLPVTVCGNVCDFEYFKLSSKNLSRNLEHCEKVIVFAATVGVEIDRLIQKYGHISPAKALMFQAIGAERIETLCDAFCSEMENELGKALKPRFSAGYGDLQLEAQKNIFSLLNPEKRIGLTLNKSMLMSPSKSVTAFVGTSDSETAVTENKCDLCEKQDCIYSRGAK